MPKKKHKQNQTVVADEVVSKGSINSQQSESQPGATNPQEHGRSMTEMLGVLAVLGVLSIGGVQGYRYAMNKYHSNEVVNELNLLNAQLAVFMSGIHDDEAVMSLGEPYDNAEKINAGGYAFAYGCGQDPDSMTPCDLDETGYYMTLNGVPKDVCKSASQMTANMMNLVEQRVNGHTDNQGILCQEENNQLTFLFDANDGQGFENGEGENGEDDENGNHPDVTLPKEDEEEGIATTTTTYETTTTITDTYTDTYTETATYTVGGECSSNSDCDMGEYCDITGYSSSCSTVIPSEAIGECRKASSDLQSKSSVAPFWVSNRGMTWWSAKNFCQALGMNMVSLDDYNCSGTYSCSSSEILRLMRNAYDYWHSWTASMHELAVDGGICGGSCVSLNANYINAICKDNGNWTPPTDCSSNSDCNNGYYCYLDDYNDCVTSSAGMRGICRHAESDLKPKSATLPAYVSNIGMTWWSAKNFCQALGTRPIAESDFTASPTVSYYYEDLKVLQNTYNTNAFWISEDNNVVSLANGGNTGHCGGACVYSNSWATAVCK